MGFIQIGSTVQSKIHPSWYGTVIDIRKANRSALVAWDLDSKQLLAWSYLDNLIPVPPRWEI